MRLPVTGCYSRARTKRVEGLVRRKKKEIGPMQYIRVFGASPQFPDGLPQRLGVRTDRRDYRAAGNRSALAMEHAWPR